jgi:site-specific DNA-methyltransferase (adenine-specific)
MAPAVSFDAFQGEYRCAAVGSSLLVHADCFEWMARIPANSIHAGVTDPPYGVKEYDLDQLAKRSNGKGGIWRIPPAFDGHARAPLPRFTALNPKERALLRRFFVSWARDRRSPPPRPSGCLASASNASRNTSTGLRLLYPRWPGWR